MKNRFDNNKSAQSLTEREQLILRSVVQRFVATADPVGSRFLSKHGSLDLSAASIRNTMSDLEEQGFLGHPYTSAGRIPTELGYRTYVDALMGSPAMSANDQKRFVTEIEALSSDQQTLIKESAHLLGKLSRLVAVVLSPSLGSALLERLELVSLSSNRVMFVISVKGGLVRTIVLETEVTLQDANLNRVVALLNERLAGLTFSEIRNTFADRVQDLQTDDRTGIISLVLNQGSALFSEISGTKVVGVSGAPNIVALPEFQSPADMQDVMSLIENRNLLTDVLAQGRRFEQQTAGKSVVIIGSENENSRVHRYSVVMAKYNIGQAVGTLGVIGPIRMDYKRVIAMVESISNTLSAPDK